MMTTEMKQKPIKFKSQWGTEYDVIFTKNSYANNGRLYVGCYCEDKEYGGYEPYCDVTVNLINNSLPKGNYGFLDTNNGDPKLFAIMEEKGYMEYIEGRYGFSGWCTYPVVKFSDEFIEMIS